MVVFAMTKKCLTAAGGSYDTLLGNLGGAMWAHMESRRLLKLLAEQDGDHIIEVTVRLKRQPQKGATENDDMTSEYHSK